MKTKTKLAVFCGIVTAFSVGHSVRARDAGQNNAPLTMAQALKLGVEDLTKYTDQSEAGQDNAAQLYATARRIETEGTLAKRDLRQVIELGHWRTVLAKCRNGSCNAAYIVNGGGTMYSHAANRNGAALEDFLADLAKRLPLKKGKGDSKAEKEIDETLAFLKKLKPFVSGDAQSDKNAKDELTAKVKELEEHWTELKAMIHEVPAEDAGKIVAIATDSMAWLKEDGGR
ncbi:MAG: hypothetical protein WCN98_13660 [Verrucomicrobiaceae bacterium]